MAGGIADPRAEGPARDAGARTTMRLQKYLARSGAGGRRHCEQLIAAGRVQVNGRVITEMGVQVDPASDEVSLDGKVLALPCSDVVIALNKPAGVYSTMADQRGRTCVADLLPMGRYPSLYHIGRLDRDTTGIMLFSTDGELGNALLHPSHHVDKEYIAQVKGRPAQEELERIRRGITVRRGEKVHACAPAVAELLPRLPAGLARQDSCLDPDAPRTSFVRVVIHEGINHQVKLMLGAIGHPVVNLHRSQFGPVSCGGLRAGRWRLLAPDEVEALRR